MKSNQFGYLTLRAGNRKCKIDIVIDSFNMALVVVIIRSITREMKTIN